MAEDASKLSEEQIYECLKTFNVVVRMNDLKVPTREFMVRVFDCFVRDLQIDVTEHELKATRHFEDAEIYEEAASLTLLAMAVNHIINPCGLNVTIKDIIEPKPKRTKKILNYVVVFWNYYLQKCVRFRAIEDTFEEERQRAENLISENQSLDERYNDKLNVLNSMQPNKEELCAIIAVKEEEVSKLKMESDSIAEDYQSMKTKEADIRNKISSTDVRIATAKQTIEELEKLILTSPERISTEIQKLEDKIKIEDLKIKELEKKCKDAEKRLNLLEEYKTEEEKDFKTLDELTETVNHLQETVKAIVSTHQKIQEAEDKLKRLQVDVYRKEESKIQYEQKFAKIGFSSRKQIETLKAALEMHQKNEARENENIEFIKAAINDMQLRIDSEADIILSVHTKCKEAAVRSKEQKAQYVAKMKEIATIFKSDCDEVLEVVRKTFPYDLEKNLDNMP